MFYWWKPLTGIVTGATGTGTGEGVLAQHVVDDGVDKNANSDSIASRNHVSKLSSSPGPGFKLKGK